MLPLVVLRHTGIGTYIWLVTNRKAEQRKGKIQLVDARVTWIAMRRSQGEKRRKFGEGPALKGDDRGDEPDQIADIVRLYGRFEAHEKSQLFGNDDFGYTRVTVERPLKLRYQMTPEDKARFLDAAPHLLDDIQAIDKALGREQQLDWNAVWADEAMRGGINQGSAKMVNARRQSRPRGTTKTGTSQLARVPIQLDNRRCSCARATSNGH